ncbi:MAG: shikimate dehydrogenase [Ignavibacteriales bacterium]|nr:shikimate dehydrogenase [Ignavibacteriales bacterium]
MKTKLCVSLFVENISDTIRKAKRAILIGADIIEFRLDNVEQESFLLEVFFEQLKKEKLFSKSIFTVRSNKEFGKWKYSEKERRDFLLQIASHKPRFLDVEFTIGNKFIQQIQNISPRTAIILSSHRKQISSSQLFSLYGKMKSLNCDVIKIAIETKTIEETSPLFSLLEKAKQENQKLIAIGMGRNGEITRILAPKFNAFLTFASLDDSLQTANGQISLQTFLDVYNFNKINSGTKTFGLIGYPVSHSKGIYVHNAAFRLTKTNAVYINCETENVERFSKSLYKHLDGFSVTAPHKETAVNLCDEISDEAKQIGAVNTIIKRGGKLFGANTDGFGFRQSFPNNFQFQNKRIAILGSGGAAKSIIATLKKENASITIFNRTISKAKVLAKEFSCNYDSLHNFPKTDFDVLINTIPFSVTKYFPETFSLLNLNWGNKIVCDIVYNPIETPLLKVAKENGAAIVHGWKMFLFQAAKQFELFTGKKAPLEVMKKVLLRTLKQDSSRRSE